MCVCVRVFVCVCVCVCFIHFRLFPFPTKKKNPTARDAWRKIINRNVNLKGCKIWEQSKDSRVCWKHFIDAEPSNENPYPTINLGYDASKKTLFLSPPSNKRKSVITEKMEIYSVAKPKKGINIGKSVVDQKKGDFSQKELLSPIERLEDETGDSDMAKVDNNEVFFHIVNEWSLDQTHDNKTDEKVNIVTGCKCSRLLLKYENTIKSLEEKLNLPS